MTVYVRYSDRPYNADGTVTVRIGSVSGIEQPDAEDMRPLHLFPSNRPLKRNGLNIKQAREGFANGRRFYDRAGNPITINDLPVGARIVLNCRKATKIHLKVTDFVASRSMATHQGSWAQ
jgi:hypothetical protein